MSTTEDGLRHELELTCNQLQRERESNAALKRDCTRLAKKLDRQSDRADRAERELHRWKHGQQVEGDYVCPHELDTQFVELLKEVLGEDETEKIAGRIEGLRADLERMSRRVRELERPPHAPKAEGD